VKSLLRNYSEAFWGSVEGIGIRLELFSDAINKGSYNNTLQVLAPAYGVQFSESIIESISEALMVIDPKDYRIIAANSVTWKTLGLRAEDVIGKFCYQATHNRQTPCEAPHNCPIREVLVTGKVATATHLHFDKEHNKIYVEISAYPFLEDNGVVTKVVHVARNITERKMFEEKLKENSQRIELINEKLRVVGGLTRHDVRNKLSAITGYAYLLKKKHPDQADIVEGLGKMEQAVKESMRIFEFAKNV
jgi:PAS domain S-box-containing protein